MRDETTLIWVETPTNPLLNVVDIEAVVERKRGAIVAVDNTFATPVVQRPLELGADAVVHSATKYLGGHSDVVGGAVVVRDGDLHERVRFVQNAIGAVPGPFDCFLVHRGLRTLHLRVAAHTENGRAVSEFLRGADGVEDVRWPGLRRDGVVPAPGRHPHRRGHGDLLAGGVARGRGVADRGAAGDDAPVRGGLGRRRAAPTWCGCPAASRTPRTWWTTCAPRSPGNRPAPSGVLVGGCPATTTSCSRSSPPSPTARCRRAAARRLERRVGRVARAGRAARAPAAGGRRAALRGRSGRPTDLRRPDRARARRAALGAGSRPPALAGRLCRGGRLRPRAGARAARRRGRADRGRGRRAGRPALAGAPPRRGTRPGPSCSTPARRASPSPTGPRSSAGARPGGAWTRSTAAAP